MNYPRTKEMAASLGRDPPAQFIYYLGLAEPGNIIGLAFHGQERGGVYGVRHNSRSLPPKQALSKVAFRITRVIVSSKNPQAPSTTDQNNWRKECPTGFSPSSYHTPAGKRSGSRKNRDAAAGGPSPRHSCPLFAAAAWNFRRCWF
jgi:hypothetical protein